ncbi:MAG: hypothetical protein PWQ39_2 [Thermacetogenium sp.]|jgi:hypothetical protein|nr:hypothetical protein [Thermacetogenium sp.]
MTIRFKKIFHTKNPVLEEMVNDLRHCKLAGWSEVSEQFERWSNGLLDFV